MAKGKRTPEPVKKEVARRVSKGEDPEVLASELNVTSDTIGEWVKQFPYNPRRVRRKVSTRPKEDANKMELNNLRKKNLELERLVEFWKEAYNEGVRNNSHS